MAVHAVHFARSCQYLDKDSISCETNNFVARMLRKMNFCAFIFNAGPPEGEILVEQTDRQTDKVTTVTLAAHVRRGLIKTFINEHYWCQTLGVYILIL